MQQIFLHGLGQTPESWDAVIEKLEDSTGCACPDLFGTLQGKVPTYENLYGSVSQICDRTDGKMDLCGLSLGAVLAMNYAIDHPEKVNSLVLVTPQYKMPKNLLRFQNLVFQLMPKSAFRQTGFKKKDLIQLSKSMTTLDFSSYLSRITCPVMIICGENDTANRKVASDLADILPDAQVRLIAGAGHAANTDAPEELAEILRGFYAGLPPESPKRLQVSGAMT